MNLIELDDAPTPWEPHVETVRLTKTPQRYKHSTVHIQSFDAPMNGTQYTRTMCGREWFTSRTSAEMGSINERYCQTCLDTRSRR